MISLAASVAFASVEAVTGRLQNGGTLEIYSGLQITYPEDALTTQTLLVTFELPVNFYQSPTLNQDGSVAVAAGEPIDPANPTSAGVATWGLVRDSDGLPIFSGNVGIIGSDAMFRLSATSLSPSVPVAIVLAQYAQPRR